MGGARWLSRVHARVSMLTRSVGINEQSKLLGHRVDHLRAPLHVIEVLSQLPVETEPPEEPPEPH